MGQVNNPAYLLLLLLLLAAGAVNPAAAGPANCTLDVQGSAGQVTKADLTCTGSRVYAAIDEGWLKKFQPRFRGVWILNSTACDKEVNVTGKGCLVTICGDTQAEFVQPVVRGVQGSEALRGLLCVTGSSRVTIIQGSFQDNQGAPAVWAGGASNLELSNSTFRNNSCAGSSGGCGLLIRGGAHADIVSSTFREHTALRGPGGALAAYDNAVVQATGGSFEYNHAADSGGACYAINRTTLTLTCGVQVANNSAARLGDDVAVASERNLVLGNTNLNTSSPSISWTQSNCMEGEVMGQDGGCNMCPPGSFSLYPINSTDGTRSTCQMCPLGAQCEGGADLTPLQGYWKSSPTSSQVHRCPHSDSCLAGGKCANGTTGNLCGAAAEGYGMRRPFTIGKCYSAFGSIGLYVACALVLFVAICLMLMSTLQDNARCIAEAKAKNCAPEEAELRCMEEAKVADIKAERWPPVSEDGLVGLDEGKKCTCPFRCGFVGVLVRHIQHLMIISIALVAWPAGLQTLFTLVNFFFNVAGLSTDLVSFQCWYRSAGKIPWAVSKLLAALITPFLMCILVALTVLAIRCLLRRLNWHSPERRDNMLTVLARASVPAVGMVSWLIVVFFFWPSLVYSSLSWFACYPIDRAGDPGALAAAKYGYWVSDIQQECFSGWHKKWVLAFAVPVAAMVLSLPLQVAGFFYMNRAKLQTEQFKAVVGFMYHNYQEANYWWEPVNAVELAAVVAVHCFSYSLGPYYSILLLNLSFATFFLLQFALHPHAYEELHRLQLSSLALLCFTTYIGLTLLPPDSGKAPPAVYAGIIGWVGMLVNVGFVVWAMWEICRLSKGKLRKAWRFLIKLVRCNWERDSSSQQRQWVQETREGLPGQQQQ